MTNSHLTNIVIVPYMYLNGINFYSELCYNVTFPYKIPPNPIQRLGKRNVSLKTSMKSFLHIFGHTVPPRNLQYMVF